jgi:hypothetical protein
MELARGSRGKEPILCPKDGMKSISTAKVLKNGYWYMRFRHSKKKRKVGEALLKPKRGRPEMRFNECYVPIKQEVSA